MLSHPFRILSRIQNLALFSASIRELRRALSVRRTRVALSRLSDERLSDIGLTREQAEDELRRGFLDVPQNFPRPR